MGNLKFSLTDILKNLRVNIFFFIQMVVVFLIFTYSMSDVIGLTDWLKRLEPLRNTQAYAVQETTSNEKIQQLFDSPEATIPKLQELYTYMVSSSVDQYSVWGVESFETVNGVEIGQVTANKQFFDFNKLEVLEGRMFSEKDFSYSDVTPILVGYNLRNEYVLDNVYDLVVPGSETEKSCKVVGVLKNNASYPQFGGFEWFYNLNYTYVVPLLATEEGLPTSAGDLDMAICSMILFTDDLEFLDSIKKRSADLDLFVLDFHTVKEDIESYASYVKEQIIYQLAILLIILFFACTGMAASLWGLVKKNMREYSIHIFCGGRVLDVALRLVTQVSIVMALALIPTIILFGGSLAVLFAVLLALVLCALILLPALSKLYTTDISSMIRTSE